MSDIAKQKKAVIEIGTHSIKLCIAENSNTSGEFSVILDDIEVTRIGAGMNEKNELMAEPSRRSIQTIQRFVKKAREYGVIEIRTVGTAALRKASNVSSFCAAIKETCDINIEIISGNMEAQLSHNAALLSSNGQECVVIDIGGGSIEFIHSCNDTIYHRFSLDFGVLNIKEKYFFYEPVEKNSVNESYFGITDRFRERGLFTEVPKLLIGIGGTYTTLALVKLKMSKNLINMVNGTIINISDVESQINQYQNLTLEERVKIPGLHSDRADIILAGACIVRTIMDYFSTQDIIVCTYGLRHAILADMFR
jgi:exopolyphosphatase/guanosine-5'-triphosphate,3'-diphosphate pyrophosphatase